MASHQKYMQRCIELARLGMGSVSPNPMVGAVIVHNGRIIGEGYHQQYGHAHAEVNAVNNVLERFDNAAELLREAIVYVSLEPCAHYGKTPPCADLIIKHHISNVVVGCRDPFPAVDGKGIEKLKAAGIEVITGVLEKECLELNKRFFTRIQKQRPYIILKWAQTKNSFFAPADGSQFWITGPEAKKLVHKWRSEEDAILIGKNTALADNPQLSTREWPGKSPKRVVIDRMLELPPGLHLMDNQAETLIFNELKTDIVDRTKYIALEDFNYFVPQYIMYQLYLQDVQSVIIEGGAATLNAFIKDGLWDEARVFTGNNVLGNGIQSPEIRGFVSNTHCIGPDLLTVYYNKEN